MRCLCLLPWVVAGVLAVNTHETVTGVYVTRLPVCQVTHYTLRSTQPVRTFTLDCPGVDSVRLWPWPVQAPWFEDGHEQPQTPGRRLQLL